MTDTHQHPTVDLAEDVFLALYYDPLFKKHLTAVRDEEAVEGSSILFIGEPAPPEKPAPTPRFASRWPVAAVGASPRRTAGAAPAAGRGPP